MICNLPCIKQPARYLVARSFVDHLVKVLTRPMLLMQAPLIGVTPLGVINGGERLRGIDVKRDKCNLTDEELREIKEKVGKETGSWKKYGYPEGRCCFDVMSGLNAGKSMPKPAGIASFDAAVAFKPADRLPPIGLERSSTDVSSNLDGKISKEAKQLRDFLKEAEVDDKEIDQHGHDIRTKRVEMFEEVSKLVAKERKKRDFFGAHLDPNHSHFIFADDGGLLNFGAETRLRADIESCVAGNFKMVGIDNGNGGKILHRVDGGISAMLNMYNYGN